MFRTTLQSQHGEVASAAPTAPNVKVFPVRHTVYCQDRLLCRVRRRCGLANQRALTNTRDSLSGQIQQHKKKDGSTTLTLSTRRLPQGTKEPLLRSIMQARDVHTFANQSQKRQ